MRLIDADKLMKKIFYGNNGKDWFGSTGADAMVMRFIDDYTDDKKVLNEADLIEISDRFGDEARYIIEDMISGQGKRWDLGAMIPESKENLHDEKTESYKKALVDASVKLFSELPALDNCKFKEASFGIICVRCNKCGRFDNEDKSF